MKKVSILNVEIHSITSNEALEYLLSRLKNGQKTAVATVNTEFIVEAQKNEEFRRQINSSDLATPDGVGVLWAARLALYAPKSKWLFLKKIEIVIVAINFGFSTLFSKSARYSGLPEQITGVDFSMKLANIARDNKYKMFLLGELPGVAEEAGERMKQVVPGLEISGAFAGDGSPSGDVETKSVLHKNPAEIVLVAYGAPKQELWIKRNLNDVPANVAIGVGGTFMFFSGRAKRAPQFVRRFGMEWLYRLITQPWRWKRQLALPKFMLLVIKDKLSGAN